MPRTHYTQFLEQVLTPSRLTHCLGVMQVMDDLAEVYDLDREQALTAGLLHDAAKDLSPAQQQQMIAEAGIEIETPCEQDYNLYLHGPVGAYFVSRELGVDDQVILDAIHMHTFVGKGPSFHAPLLWCLRFADLLEPNRNWGDVPQLRQGRARLKQTVYAGRLQEGAVLHTGWLMQMFEAKGFPIHPNIRTTYQEFSRQLNLDDTFLDQRPL